MKSARITTAVRAALYIIIFVAVIVACDTEQVMMHGGRTMDLGNWNWLQILIGIIIGLLLGYLFARRRK